jgi:hypothetical protein
MRVNYDIAAPGMRVLDFEDSFIDTRSRFTYNRIDRARGFDKCILAIAPAQ